MFFSWSKMEAIIVIGIAGFIGANVRYLVSIWAAQAFGSAFPWGTLIINVSGAFVIGLFGAMAEDTASIMASRDSWLFAVTGFLGAYTTVSSFSLQTLTLTRDGQNARAVSYVALSVGLCLGAVALGFFAGQVLK